MIWQVYSLGQFAILHVEIGMKTVSIQILDGLIFARSLIAEKTIIMIFNKITIL